MNNNAYKEKFFFLLMLDQSYQKIVSKIAKASGLGEEEIERRIEAKRAKLSGLISKEGAAQVVAAELGVNFDNEILKIEELLPGMRKANVIGKVINVFPTRTFTTKKGDEGKVSNFIIADDTSNIKVVLWDTHHIELVENGEISENSIVEINNASMRGNELHLGSFSKLKLSKEKIGDVVKERVVKEKNVADFLVSDNVQTRAFIVQTFDPRFFHVCPECNKKVVSGSEGFICEAHGKVSPDKRALINLVLDDGTETIRAVAFHETLGELGINDLEDGDKILNQRENLLGKEMIFKGNVRTNKFFNNSELIVNEVKEIDLDSVIAKLEKG